MPSLKKRAAPKQRQSVRSQEEASEYARWYQAQPVDPSSRYVDPVVAFRRQQPK